MNFCGVQIFRLERKKIIIKQQQQQQRDMNETKQNNF